MRDKWKSQLDAGGGWRGVKLTNKTNAVVATGRALLRKPMHNLSNDNTGTKSEGCSVATAAFC